MCLGCRPGLPPRGAVAAAGPPPYEGACAQLQTCDVSCVDDCMIQGTSKTQRYHVLYIGFILQNSVEAILPNVFHRFGFSKKVVWMEKPEPKLCQKRPKL